MKYTDRELLEFAAKAANLYHPDGFDWLVNPLGFQWNPLDDDGDAIRLAIDLKLSVIQDLTENVTAVYWTDVHCCNQAHKEDAYEATRRAIVRAAVAKYEQQRNKS